MLVRSRSALVGAYAIVARAVLIASTLLIISVIIRAIFMVSKVHFGTIVLLFFVYCN